MQYADDILFCIQRVYGLFFLRLLGLIRSGRLHTKIVFLHNSNEQFKNKIKKTIPIIIPSK